MSLFDDINSIEDVKRLLIDERLEEGDFIDYKQSGTWDKGASASSIAKHASAFANANGGMLVFGVKTRKSDLTTLPESIVGIPQENIPRIKRALHSHVRPAIEHVRWKPINLDGEPVILLAEVAPSPRAPHQHSESCVYYRRFGDESRPMTHDLVELYFGRRLGPIVTPRVEDFTVGVEDPASGRVRVQARVSLENIGAGAARDILMVLSQRKGEVSLKLQEVRYEGRDSIFGRPRKDVIEFRAAHPSLVLHPTDTASVFWMSLVGFGGLGLYNEECARIRVFADRMVPSEWILRSEHAAPQRGLTFALERVDAAVRPLELD